MVLGHPSRSAFSTSLITSSRISAQPTTLHRLRGERGGRGTMTSRTTTRAANELSPPKSVCAGDAVLRTSWGTVHMGQCDGLQKQHLTVPISTMTYTAENPHADGSASPGARPRYQPPCHRDLPATSRTHDNWMESRQTSCCQQTAVPQPCCSKDVTVHPHLPGARPDLPCPVPACSGQPPSNRYY
jgi:hypothetical protein